MNGSYRAGSLSRIGGSPMIDRDLSSAVRCRWRLVLVYHDQYSRQRDRILICSSELQVVRDGGFTLGLDGIDG